MTNMIRIFTFLLVPLLYACGGSGSNNDDGGLTDASADTLTQTCEHHGGGIGMGFAEEFIQCRDGTTFFDKSFYGPDHISGGMDEFVPDDRMFINE